MRQGAGAGDENSSLEGLNGAKKSKSLSLFLSLSLARSILCPLSPSAAVNFPVSLTSISLLPVRRLDTYSVFLSLSLFL